MINAIAAIVEEELQAIIDKPLEFESLALNSDRPNRLWLYQFIGSIEIEDAKLIWYRIHSYGFPPPEVELNDPNCFDVLMTIIVGTMPLEQRRKIRQ